MVHTYPHLLHLQADAALLVVDGSPGGFEAGEWTQGGDGGGGMAGLRLLSEVGGEGKGGGGFEAGE